MQLDRVRLCLVCTLLCWVPGCRRQTDPGPATPPAVSPITPDLATVVSVPPPAPSTASDAPKPVVAEAATEVAPVELVALPVVADAKAGDTPRTLKTATGSLQVWSAPSTDGKKSDIIGRVLDHAGKPVGAAHLLRHTSGRVVSLALVERDGCVYLGWASVLGSDKGDATLVAVLRASLDLSAASAPVTIEHGTRMSPKEVSSEGERSGPTVTLLAPARGGAVVTFYNSFAPETVWSSYVSPTLALRRWGEIKADGGDGSFGGMIDLGSGALVWTFAWRGGASWGQEFFSYVPEDREPKLLLGNCRPPMQYYFNGTELITYCPSDYRQDKEHCPIEGGSDLCARLFVQRLDGTYLTKSRDGATVPVLKQKVVCQSGRWTRQLSWAGGSVLLDPERPGPPDCRPGERAPAFAP